MDHTELPEETQRRLDRLDEMLQELDDMKRSLDDVQHKLEMIRTSQPAWWQLTGAELRARVGGKGY